MKMVEWELTISTWGFLHCNMNQSWNVIQHVRISDVPTVSKDIPCGWSWIRSLKSSRRLVRVITHKKHKRLYKSSTAHVMIHVAFWLHSQLSKFCYSVWYPACLFRWAKLVSNSVSMVWLRLVRTTSYSCSIWNLIWIWSFLNGDFRNCEVIFVENMILK